MQRIIPSHIRRIKHSEYNIDPEGKNGIDSFLLHQLEREDKSLESMETELIPSPFVQIPLGIMEDNRKRRLSTFIPLYYATCIVFLFLNHMICIVFCSRFCCSHWDSRSRTEFGDWHDRILSRALGKGT